MAQLTIYIDNDCRKRIASAARQAGTSMSRWVTGKLTQALKDEWPEGYFQVLGSLRDTDLARPPQPVLRHDSRRRRL
jgi:hypothetical protein